MKKVVVISMAALLLVAGLVFAERGAAAMRGQMAERRLGCDPGSGWGRGQMGGGNGMGPGMFLALADKLELTDQQKAQLQKMQEDFQLQRVDEKAKVEKAQIQLRNLMRDPASPEKEVLSAIDEVAQLRANMTKMQFTHMRQCRSVLTDKQIDMLKDLRKDRMDKRFDQSQGQNAPGPGTGPHRQGRGM